MTIEAAGAGALLAILRHGEALTRTELMQLTGLARSTVSQRLDALLDHRWIMPAGDAISSGGRPAVAFTFNAGARVVLAADLGATHARLAVTDLATQVLAERSQDMAITEGPERVLEWLVQEFESLLRESGHTLSDICGVGIGLPGPVEHSTGQPVNPPIMPGWDGFDVPGWLEPRLGAPVLVDNDVNIMALGEHWAVSPEIGHMLFVKVGTGIGCGIITEHRLHRGAQGAAGDIGHVQVTTAPERVCRCGNIGCLEAVAGGAAIAEQLRAAGQDTADSRDAVALVRSGNPAAIQMIRQAGRDIGEVLASLVNFFNPGAIVIGGDLSDAGEHLLAGVRELIYSRSLPLATQHLTVRVRQLGDRAGVIGASVMVLEHVLSPTAVDRSVAGA
ncbi:ROK family protein [Streptomyces davaonensis JCM 4913]|uniref:ROK family protein n=1 Tax=Streptomyces davaonensis (strain DSM 101723 / JCM 4913 / KCC S-0913 / 768) TaxID=1214101 RepID=K4R0R2_STRDJ|nr:ROK family protein [Streptomyces davaonensis]CCK26908.1 ROK family protein [Streptomyces davaonensis JCM 4913]